MPKPFATWPMHGLLVSKVHVVASLPPTQRANGQLAFKHETVGALDARGSRKSPRADG